MENYRRRKAAEAQAAEVAALRRDADAIAGAIASTEEDVASDNHAAGTCLVVGGVLYRATTPIVRGERIREGVNVVATTVADEISAMQERQ